MGYKYLEGPGNGCCRRASLPGSSASRAKRTTRALRAVTDASKPPRSMAPAKLGGGQIKAVPVEKEGGWYGL